MGVNGFMNQIAWITTLLASVIFVLQGQTVLIGRIIQTIDSVISVVIALILLFVETTGIFVNWYTVLYIVIGNQIIYCNFGVFIAKCEICDDLFFSLRKAYLNQVFITFINDQT